MFLEIVTPEKTLFSGEVKLVNLPGTEGSFGILKNHAPLISTLSSGIIKVINSENKEEFFNISKGVAEIQKNNIIILASE